MLTKCIAGAISSIAVKLKLINHVSVTLFQQINYVLIFNSTGSFNSYSFASKVAAAELIKR